MTVVRMHGVEMARAVPWVNAQGVAVACLGLLLLGATVFSQLVQSGPAFPSLSAGSPRAVADAGDAAVAGGLQGTRRAVAQVTPSAAGPKSLPPSPLDINRADAEALRSLPGMGPTLAGRVVAYREAHGPFRRVEELVEVPGIGPKRYARFQQWVRAAEGP